MKRFIRACLLLIVIASPLFAQIHFGAKLTGAQVVPPVATAAGGVGSFLLNADRTSLEYHITVCNLSGGILSAAFCEESIGNNGGAVRDITFSGNTASGTWETGAEEQPLSSEMITALLDGNIYVVIRTAANPGGEIRGQVGSRSYLARLDGSQQEPPVVSDGSGSGFFALSEDLTVLSYQMTVCDLSSSITQAHFYKGAFGVAGDIVKTIAFSNNTASGEWSATDAMQPLTAELVTALLNGKIYVSVHTAGNQEGEIRGQLIAISGIATMAMLTGSQEVPPVNTTASGTGIFVLNHDMSEISYDITVCGLSGPVAQAHFNNNAFGATGLRMREISFAEKTARGVWRPIDPQPLTPQLVKEFLSGKIYVNLHTMNNQSGEIRGQLMHSGLRARFSGSQEVPPTTNGTTGAGSFQLSADLSALKFDIAICGLSGPVAFAHFHLGAPGQSGNNIRTIPFTGNVASGVWRASDINEPLAKDYVDRLLNGGLYVNIHTAININGETRGQIEPVSGIVTSVERHEGGAPEEFFLAQNYPNPFNPSTTISFHLPGAGEVTLKVYNLLGDEITTLISAMLDAGEHVIEWNAGGLPSGLYFYKIKTAGYAAVGKALLLK